MRYKIMTILAAAAMMAACGSTAKKQTAETNDIKVAMGPAFNPDSAYSFCEAQCAFGPRNMNSDGHEKCAGWIAEKFRQYGMDVQLQKADLKGYDDTRLKATNIIASYRKDLKDRILLCAHYDTRPWSDNDTDTANWSKPVIGANDGASGVAVLIEVARLISGADSLKLGVDFICFDAEDWGAPQFETSLISDGGWVLGSTHWANNPHTPGYSPRFGILLDMVGGQGATFYQESISLHYAPEIVDKVWQAASDLGYSGLFPKNEGGMITDDHVPLNQIAGIPTIDIVPYYPHCAQSSFGPTWHTVNDTMESIDRNTLMAVGQTVIQVLYSE